MSKLPKEQQSAYQRWEMTSFGDNRPSVAARRTPPPAPEPEPEPELELDLTPAISEEELAELRQQARADGHEEGWAAGREEGLASGREEGLAAGHEAGYSAGLDAGRAEALEQGRAATAVELDHVRDLAQQFGAALQGADQLIAGEVLDLALHLARGMLGGALRARPELILPLVQQALNALPSLQLPAELALNPLDARVVREGIGEELEKDGWRIVEDAQVGRGGCRIDTASNQIDAQAATIWHRLTHALGKDLEWLEP